MRPPQGTQKRGEPLFVPQLAALLRQTNQLAEVAAREMIVPELYRRWAISSAKAAELPD